MILYILKCTLWMLILTLVRHKVVDTDSQDSSPIVPCFISWNRGKYLLSRSLCLNLSPYSWALMGVVLVMGQLPVHLQNDLSPSSFPSLVSLSSGSLPHNAFFKPPFSPPLFSHLPCCLCPSKSLNFASSPNQAFKNMRFFSSLQFYSVFYMDSVGKLFCEHLVCHTAWNWIKMLLKAESYYPFFFTVRNC